MKKIGLAWVLGLLATAAIGGAVLAGGGSWGEVTPHSHVLLNGVEFGPDGTATYKKCVDLAAGKALRGSAHHDSVHIGVAGGSPFVEGALFNAGHLVIPMQPFLPPHLDWDGCDDLPPILDFGE